MSERMIPREGIEYKVPTPGQLYVTATTQLTGDGDTEEFQSATGIVLVSIEPSNTQMAEVRIKRADDEAVIPGGVGLYESAGATKLHLGPFVCGAGKIYASWKKLTGANQCTISFLDLPCFSGIIESPMLTLLDVTGSEGQSAELDLFNRYAEAVFDISVNIGGESAAELTLNVKNAGSYEMLETFNSSGRYLRLLDIPYGLVQFDFSDAEAGDYAKVYARLRGRG